MDWAGTYSGTIPCASCPGINTHITLNADGTFEKSEEYLEEKDGVFDTKGTFVWLADGSSVTLDEQVYRVGENELIMLDAAGNVVEGDLAENYILKKTEFNEEPLENPGLPAQVYAGSDGNDVLITFDTAGDKPVARIERGDFEAELVQTEVWAKGAEYEKDGIKLRSQGDKGTLYIDNKEIQLNRK